MKTVVVVPPNDQNNDHQKVRFSEARKGGGGLLERSLS